MKYILRIGEKRRNPELNPRIAVYDALLPYKDDPNMYVSFTKLDKIGINPQTKYKTPVGVYSYPLKEVWKKYNVDQVLSVGAAVPFAGDMPYVWLITPSKPNTFIDDLSTTYSESDYERDKEILINWMIKEPKFNPSAVKVEDSVKRRVFGGILRDYEEETRDKNIPAARMWYVTRNLASWYKYGDAYLRKDAVAVWNFIMRTVLGYSGMADKKGVGIIHPAEPMQAIFLSKTAFKVVQQFINKDYIELKKQSKRFLTIPDGHWIHDADIGKVKELGQSYSDPRAISAYEVEWKDGVWVDGKMNLSIWWNGTWEYGIFTRGTWLNGTWESGSFVKSSWKNGVWKDGRFIESHWIGGEWLGGRWEDSWIYDPENRISDEVVTERNREGFAKTTVDPSEIDQYKS